MSAGGFVNARMKLDNGDVCVVRVQPETLLADFSPGDQNVGSANSPTLPGRYPLNMGGRRRLPFSSRYVVVEFTAVVPEGYKAGEKLKIPILLPEVFNDITLASTGVYLNLPIRVVSKVRQAGG